MLLLPDDVTFNATMSACEKGGRWEWALHLLADPKLHSAMRDMPKPAHWAKEMRRSSPRLDVISFSAVPWLDSSSALTFCSPLVELVELCFAEVISACGARSRAMRNQQSVALPEVLNRLEVMQWEKALWFLEEMRILACCWKVTGQV